jgi:antitoxin ParD1/3/4
MTTGSRKIRFYATLRREAPMTAAEKISVTMTSEMIRVIRKSVESGEFASTSEVLRDALRAWQRERREHAERLAAIRARIRRSLDDPRPECRSMRLLAVSRSCTPTL